MYSKLDAGFSDVPYLSSRGTKHSAFIFETVSWDLFTRFSTRALTACASVDTYYVELEINFKGMVFSQDYLFRGVAYGVELSFKVRFDRVLFLTDINQSESFCISLCPLPSLISASIFGCVKENLKRAVWFFLNGATIGWGRTNHYFRHHLWYITITDQKVSLHIYS